MLDLKQITKDEARELTSLGVTILAAWHRDDARPIKVRSHTWFSPGPDSRGDPWVYYVETE